MTVILALWTTLTWAITYIYMSHKAEKLKEHIKKIEQEYGDIMDDWHEHYIDDRLMEYAECESNEDGTWNQVF
jgi:DNA anti-recombination protein RmuC